MDALTAGPAARSKAAYRLQVAVLGAGLVGAVVAAIVQMVHLAPESDRLQAAWRASYASHLAMLDQETSLRGFVATRDPSYLQPFARGAADLVDANAELERTIGSDRVLAPLLVRTRVSQERWIERWASAAQQADTSHDGAFLAEGKTQFDAYRESQGTLASAIEARSLANDAKRRAVRVFVLVLLLGLLAAVVLLAARERRARDSYEHRLHVLLLDSA